jgi:molybdopterin-guanine dinucleotide biosynthesis protein A
MSSNDVRKNFVFKKEVAEHLKELALKDNKSMTKVLEELIETKYLQVSKEDKLKAFHKFVQIMQKSDIPKGGNYTISKGR